MLRYCPKGKNQFKCIVLPCIIGVATGGLIFQLLYFLPALQDEATRYLFETSCILLYTMCFFSYYRTITITNTIPQTLIAPRLRHQLFGNHSFYTQKKQCEKQNRRYKPPRTSHCHICKCVTRMDHHCPYTDGCIGANNYKPFILFCFYGGLFALQYLLLSTIFYFKLRDGKATLSEIEILVWMLFNLFGGLLSFSMNGLWISNLTMACKNITQLDLIKGNFKFQDKTGVFPNPFDVGAYSNINSIFNSDIWLFWWPSETVHYNDGTQFPMRPPVTASDIKDLPNQIQIKLKNGEKVMPKSLEQLHEKYESQFQGVVFFYLGKQYRLTPKQIKDQLRKITQISSKEVEQDKDDEDEMGEYVEAEINFGSSNQMTEEQKSMFESLYADDANL